MTERSKYVGVYYVKEKKRSPRWEYRFKVDGFSSRQSFSISKFGFEEARKMAEREIIKLYDRFDLSPLVRFGNV